MEVTAERAWAICYPRSDGTFGILVWTVRGNRSSAIKEWVSAFVRKPHSTWRHWRDTKGYRAMRVNVSILTGETP